jgi:hypothetical protein
MQQRKARKYADWREKEKLSGIFFTLIIIGNTNEYEIEIRLGMLIGQ